MCLSTNRSSLIVHYSERRKTQVIGLDDTGPTRLGSEGHTGMEGWKPLVRGPGGRKKGSTDKTKRISRKNTAKKNSREPGEEHKPSKRGRRGASKPDEEPSDLGMGAATASCKWQPSIDPRAVLKHSEEATFENLENLLGGLAKRGVALRRLKKAREEHEKAHSDDKRQPATSTDPDGAAEEQSSTDKAQSSVCASDLTAIFVASHVESQHCTSCGVLST